MRSAHVLSLIMQLLVVAGLGAGGWYAYDAGWLDGEAAAGEQARGGGRGDRGVAAILEPLHTSRQTLVFETVATAQARRSVTLRARAEGIVQDVSVTPDQWIAEGVVILALESESYLLAVERAEVAMKAAQMMAERLGSAGGAMVDGSQIIQAQADLSLAEVDLRQARRALAERTLRAPFAGHVGLSEIEIGDRVSNQDVIATFDDRSALILDFRLPEQMIGRVEMGTAVQVMPFTGEEQAREAQLVSFDSRLDPVTRSIRVRAQLPNPDDRLRPGMAFRVRLEIPGDSYPRVPEAAVTWGVDGAQLWVVREGKAERVAVEIIERLSGATLVSGDIRADDLIVVEGVQHMRPGAAVAPADLPTPAPIPVTTRPTQEALR